MDPTLTSLVRGGGGGGRQNVVIVYSPSSLSWVDHQTSIITSLLSNFDASVVRQIPLISTIQSRWLIIAYSSGMIGKLVVELYLNLNGEIQDTHHG